MNTCDNLPPGAELDSRAPYNEPLMEEYERFVSVTLSYYDKVEVPAGSSECDIRDAITTNIMNRKFPKVVSIDDVEIFED